jgi:hypothetical protein
MLLKTRESQNAGGPDETEALDADDVAPRRRGEAELRSRVGFHSVNDERRSMRG